MQIATTFFSRFTSSCTARYGGGIPRVVSRASLNNDFVLHCYVSKPACLRMDAQVFGFSSSLIFPGIVTRPGRCGCLYCRWLPRVPTCSHPAARTRRSASRTVMGTDSASLRRCLLPTRRCALVSNRGAFRCAQRSSAHTAAPSASNCSWRLCRLDRSVLVGRTLNRVKSQFVEVGRPAVNSLAMRLLLEPDHAHGDPLSSVAGDYTGPNPQVQ